ncbi:SDR family NAD(P)-dependent oxidoreductase [Naumannella halotolerans]|uniref:SDR family NAD(P)-dependent oxidoreductase n=1 Tax=Naumannella halotolerans TaxID=993414 RepID=UPI00370D2ECD
MSLPIRRALITGGTSGIGAAFARALAARGVDLVLVARDSSRLTRAQEELSSAYGIRVETLPADLADRDRVETVAARIEDTGTSGVDMVINNAGFGLPGELVTPDQALHDRAFEVMIRSVMVLSAAAARQLRANGGGIIINVSSTAGWITTGNYSAIKSWTTVYSEALANQLRGTGVTVTALAPGWVHTEFHDRAGVDASKLPEAVFVDADRLVAECLRDAAVGKIISVPTPQWAAAIQIARHAPRAGIRWLSRKLSSARE